jgi:phosphoadenosine phosphosulfate reductase
MTPNLLTITPELTASVAAKTAAAQALLAEIAGNWSPAAFANSLGAEDMVLTDLIVKAKLSIEIFSLDTGRLPLETYDLMAAVQKHYKLKLKIYFPQSEEVESFVRNHGINAFYESVTLRKACCYARKVEPLRRALAGKRAWITGMRAEQAATRGNLAVREYDEGNGLEKFNPLADWSDKEVWTYIKQNAVPYNTLHDKFYPSIGCAPCTRAISPGEDIRSGRWWWENADTKECGLHVKATS